MAHNVNGATLTPIYERLNGVANYHPLDAETFGDWSMEAGDIVEVTRDGKSYSSPVHTSSITWRGRAPVMAINTTGNQKRDPVAKVARRKYGGSGASMRNDQYFISELTSEDGTLHSLISQTTTYIMTAVDDTASDLHSQIVQTAGMIESSVATAQSQMYTVIRQTSTEIFNGVYNDLSGDFATIVQTSTMIATSVNSARSSLYSTIQQTSTSIMTEVVKKNRLFVQLTDPALTVPDLHDGDVWVQSSGVRTWNQVAQKVWTAIGSLQWRQLYGSVWFVRKNGAWEKHMDEAAVVEQKVRIEQDEEHYAILAREVDSDRNTFQTMVQTTAREITTTASASKSEIYSEIRQTATNILSTVADTRNALTTQIEQTASQIQSTASAARSTLYSVIRQTATNIMSTVASTRSDVFTQIEQTASQIRSEVNASKSTIWSSITQTSTQISLKVGKGEVISSINQTAESVTINASKINLSGYVKATDLTASYINGIIANIATMTVQNISSERGGISVASVGTTTFVQGGVTCYVPNAIMDVRIDGPTNNTYKLQRKRFNDSDWVDCQSFSRATSLSGEWSGTVAAGKSYKVTASPQGDVHYSPQLDGISRRDDKTWASDKKSFTQTLYAYDEDGTEIVDDNMTFYTTDSYNAGHTSGWEDARAEVSAPSAGTGTTFSVGVPSATEGEGTTLDFTMTKGTPGTSGYAAVSDGVNAVARIDISNWYTAGHTAGWADAWGEVHAPSAGTNTTFSVSVPSSTEDTGATMDFTITKGATPSSSGYAAVSCSWTNGAVGRIPIGDWYTAGYEADHSMFIGDENCVAKPSSITLSPGDSIEVWAYFKNLDDETYQWSPKYTIAAQSLSWSYGTLAKTNSIPSSYAKKYDVDTSYRYWYFNVTVNGVSKRILLDVLGV